jgi:hypothetical protein
VSEIPTKWATVEIGWGEGKKHIYSLNDWEIGYYDTEEKAREAAKEMISSGEANMMAILEVKTILVPKPIEFTETA